MPEFLGIDIGGTNIKIARVNEAGKILNKEMFPTEKEKGPGYILQKVKNKILSLNLKEIKSIGIGIAGLVNFKKSIIVFCPNLKWRNIDLLKEFKGIRKRIYVDNDANCAAWGCYLSIGEKNNSQNILTITLGTGIGGGLVINKKIYRGANGYAGEIGHIKLFPYGKTCTCGDYGCLEAYAGAGGIKSLAQIEIGEKLKFKKLTEISGLLYNLSGGNLKNLTPEIISIAAKKNDKISIRVLKKIGEYIGIGISTCINILDPDLIVLSGGISNAGSLILNPVKETVIKRALTVPEIIIAKDPQNIGVIGSALLEKSF